MVGQVTPARTGGATDTVVVCSQSGAELLFWARAGGGGPELGVTLEDLTLQSCCKAKREIA